MKVSELKKILEGSKYGKAPCYDDENVFVLLKEPSLGSRSMSLIKSAYFGFDWESGRLILEPTKDLSTKRYKEKILDRAYDLIMQLAAQKTYKGNPTSLAKYAQEILDMAGEE